MKSNPDSPIPELLRLFHQVLTTGGDQPAYRFIDDSGEDRILTYRELFLKASTLARSLGTHPPGEQSRALLIYGPGFDFIISLFACFFSGTVAIPIAIPKPRTADLFHHFFAHANPSCILTTAALEPRIRNLLPPGAPASCALVVTDKIEPGNPFPLVSTNRNLAMIQYTSGTTTSPRGVTITFENIYHNLAAIGQHFNLTEKSVCFSWLPHHHDMGLIDGLLTPLFNHCTAILCSPVSVVSNPIRWIEIIDRYKVTHTGGPNFFFDMCADRISESLISKFNLKSLSHLYVSAEPVRRKTLEKFTALFAGCGFQPDCFTPGYGLAEATLMVTCKSIRSPLQYYVRDNQEHVGLGKAIPGIDIRIIDPRSGRLITDGATGEICLNGPTVTNGYFRNQASSQSFIGLTVEGKQNLYFRTGDLGFLENSELCVIGRLKDTMIIRGLKYQPEDIEYIIAHSHPQLVAMNNAVFSLHGEDGEKVVVLQETAAEIVQTGDLKTHIRQAVFETFGISVFDIILLPHGRIARTTSGKIRRQDNRLKYLQGEFAP